MKLLGSTKKDVDKDKYGENAPKLESADWSCFISLYFSQKWLPTHIKSFAYFCAKQTIWTVNKYFTIFFNDDEHS